MKLAIKNQRKASGTRILCWLFFIVALFPALLSAKSALGATPQPIEGDWHWLNATIRVTATGPNTYTGAVLVPGSGEGLPCFGVEDVVWNLNGSGFSYTGTTNWVDINSCSPLGPGSSTWTLSSDTEGQYCSTDPTGQRGTICYPITKEPKPSGTVEILFKSFIPYNYLVAPEPALIGFPLCQFYVYAGDDREFDYDSVSFRTYQKIFVKLSTDQKSQFSDRVQLTGTTKLYCGPVAVADGRIDTSDVPLATGKESSDRMHIETRPSGIGRAIVKLRGSSTNPLVNLIGGVVPKIDWCYNIMLDLSTDGSINYHVVGGNDNFPAYELYLNKKPVVQFMPSAPNPFLLIGGCHDSHVNIRGTIN